MLILQSPSNFYFLRDLFAKRILILWLNCIFYLFPKCNTDFIRKYVLFLNERESCRRIASMITIVALLIRAFGSKSVVSLCTRIQYKIVSTTEFQKPRHVDPVSSTLFPARWANSIRPFSTRLPMLSRNPIRKAGGMHQLVKLRYLTSPPSFLSSL